MGIKARFFKKSVFENDNQSNRGCVEVVSEIVRFEIDDA